MAHAAPQSICHLFPATRTSSGRGARTLTPFRAGAFKAPVSAIPPSRRWKEYKPGESNVNMAAALDLVYIVVVLALAADLGPILAAEEHE